MILLLLGLPEVVSSYTVGGFIPVLPVVAASMGLIQSIQGRKAL